MIEERIGDIFEQADLDVIAHQANCYCTFGSGIAAVIKEKFPEAYEADCKTKKGDLTKLGTYSTAFIKRENRKFVIANVYGQGGYGNRNYGGRDTNYDALYDGLSLLRDDLVSSNPPRKMIVGLPYGLGSALGGGKWHVVKAIIEDIFDNHDKLTAVVCRLPNQKDL